LKKCWKKIKKYISKKNILEHLGNCRILVEEDQNIQDWKIWQCIFIDEDPIGKENSTWGGKFKIEFLRTQLESFKV